MKKLILLKIEKDLSRFEEKLKSAFFGEKVEFVEIKENTIKFSYYNKDIKKTRFILIDYETRADKEGFVNKDKYKTTTTLLNNRGEVVDIKTDDIVYILLIIKFVNNYTDRIEDEYESILIKAERFIDDFIFIYKEDKESFIYKYKDLEVIIDNLEVLKIIKNKKDLENQNLLNEKDKESLSEMKVLQEQEIGDIKDVLLLNRDDDIYINKKLVKGYLNENKKYNFCYKFGNLINDFYFFNLIGNVVIGLPFLFISILEGSKVMAVYFPLYFLHALFTCVALRYLSDKVFIGNYFRERISDNKDELYIKYEDTKEVLSNFGYKKMIKDIDNRGILLLENREEIFALEPQK